MRTKIKLILESLNKIKSFEKKYDLELPENITTTQLKDLEEAFSYLPKNFVKHHIKKIEFKDLGAVHGRYVQERKKGDIILNPSIFEYKKYFKIQDKKIPVKIFTIIHEIGHMMDHLKGVTDTKEWKNLSGWKKLDIDKKVPDDYKRYIEKRKGRVSDKKGHKKSMWIHKKDAEFSRNYGSKGPREDFADLFAFVILGKTFNFKDKGQDKIKTIEDLLA